GDEQADEDDDDGDHHQQLDQRERSRPPANATRNPWHGCDPSPGESTRTMRDSMSTMALDTRVRVAGRLLNRTPCEAPGHVFPVVGERCAVVSPRSGRGRWIPWRFSRALKKVVKRKQPKFTKRERD